MDLARQPDESDPLRGDARRLAALAPSLRLRADVTHALHVFFRERDFLEVTTPVRLPAPAPEVHIDAEPSGDHWLRTSPELHMKRLLCAGYPRIVQLGPCFRRHERGRLHHPEFTLLEWYRTPGGADELLRDTGDLLRTLCHAVHGSSVLPSAAGPIDLAGEWRQMTVAQAFREAAGWDPTEHFDADRFDLDMVEKVEPWLPRNVPVVLRDYPLPSAALARRKPGPHAVADRWELYLDGIELANAYGELTDAVEQRQRFVQWNEQRSRLGFDVYPLDEDFLSSLSVGLPPCGGIALGFDRLVMLLAGAASLDDITAFPPVDPPRTAP